jgi:hypothetical protein
MYVKYVRDYSELDICLFVLSDGVLAPRICVLSIVFGEDLGRCLLTQPMFRNILLVLLTP